MAYNELFAYLCCLFCVIGYLCAAVGIDVEFDAKFTIIVGHNSCTCQGSCMESCGFWCYKCGMGMVKFSKWVVRVAEVRQWELPEWVAAFVNQKVDLADENGYSDWHVI